MKWLMRMVSKSKKNRDGFTLIELMVVLIIIAILAVAAVPTYMYFVQRNYESEAAASLGAIKTAQIVYHAEHGEFTQAWGSPGLGMVSGDFAQNKWFHHPCFYIYTTGLTPQGFTAYADGSTGGETEVDDIAVSLTNNSDVLKGSPGDAVAIGAVPCP